MSLKLPKNTSLQDLYLEDDQTIWFLVWILKQSSPCDQYISQMILESPFQVIQDINLLGWPRQYIRKNGKLHGLSHGWYRSGQLRIETHWKNGGKHGLDRGWYENDQLWYEKYWKNGGPDGPSRAWYPNGKLEYEHNWKNGVYHGPQRGWYDSGQLRIETHWKNGTVVSSKKIE